MGDTTEVPSSAILDTRLVEIHGRPFVLTVLVANPLLPDGTREPFLCLSIQGDQRTISFQTSAGPYRPSVEGDVIRFGRHTFSVTAVPGTYSVDGVSVVLRESGRVIHCFVDGSYSGSEGF
jgi:hypothetical protein